MKKRKLYIFHATDYENFPLGGTLGTIKIFIKYTRFDCVLIGISNKNKNLIGKWQTIKIHGKDYPFLPVAYDKNGKIPHKLKLFFGLIFYSGIIRKFFINDNLNAMIFVNRESFIPVRYIIGRDKTVNVFYKMTEAVNPLTTSGHRLAKFKLLQKIYYKFFIQPLLRGSSTIFSINQQCRDFCQKTLTSHCQKQKIIDVNHYVDYDNLLKIYNKAKPWYEDNYSAKKRLIFWGRLAVVKGLDLMIKGIAELMQRGIDVELLIIGDGPERSNLEKLVKTLDLDKCIFFLGRKGISEIAALSKCSDLFLMSSYSEGIPTSMLEALTFGLPVFSTAVGGIPSLITEEVNAYLINNRNSSDYAFGIIKALQLDRKRAMDCGRNHINTYYAAKNVIKQMDNVINRSIDSDKDAGLL
ncbi:glycosyltransferase [uncultured Desulfosarcina sp.]|uniref:glycosyltransferase n=1 Tax=uncultured Desulfosarcina sp. TaxID=218289 RepID=UPI0029C7D03B|nr:glycosyltransferase [uncultured Desulfosarcina sp.]